MKKKDNVKPRLPRLDPGLESAARWVLNTLRWWGQSYLLLGPFPSPSCCRETTATQELPPGGRPCQQLPSRSTSVSRRGQSGLTAPPGVHWCQGFEKSSFSLEWAREGVKLRGQGPSPSATDSIDSSPPVAAGPVLLGPGGQRSTGILSSSGQCLRPNRKAVTEWTQVYGFKYKSFSQYIMHFRCTNLHFH